MQRWWWMKQNFYALSMHCLFQSMFLWEYSMQAPPFLCGHILMPWLSSISGTVVGINTSCLVKQGYKATFWLVARVPLWLGGRYCASEGEDTSLSVHLTWRGTYLLHPLFGLANYDTVLWAVMVVFQSTVWWHLWAMTLNPSAKCMWFCPTVTPTSHYLSSSPIFGKCSGGCPW